MRGSKLEEKLDQAYEQYKEYLTAKFHNELGESLAMMRLFLGSIKNSVESEVPPPPPPPAPIEESSSSIVLEELSESSDISKKRGKDKEEEDDDIVVSSSVEPPTFPKKVMDDWFIDKNLPPKRIRKQRQIWSPNDHKNEREDEKGEDLGQDTPEESNVKEFKQFILSLRNIQRKASRTTVLYTSGWFQKQWGKQLNGIRDNLGRESGNVDCKQLFDDIITDTLWETPGISFTYQKGERDTCALCNMEKRCNAKYGEYKLAVCCASIARALIAFFGKIVELINDPTPGGNWMQQLITLDDLFGDIQKAHASKRKFRNWT